MVLFPTRLAASCLPKSSTRFDSQTSYDEFFCDVLQNVALNTSLGIVLRTSSNRINTAKLILRTIQPNCQRSVRRVGHRLAASAAGRRDDIVGHRDVNRPGKESKNHFANRLATAIKTLQPTAGEQDTSTRRQTRQIEYSRCDRQFFERRGRQTSPQTDLNRYQDRGLLQAYPRSSEDAILRTVLLFRVSAASNLNSPEILKDWGRKICRFEIVFRSTHVRMTNPFP